jgi:hypothetical protein
MSAYTIVINRKQGHRTVYQVRHDATGLILHSCYSFKEAQAFKPPVQEVEQKVAA